MLWNGSVGVKFVPDAKLYFFSRLTDFYDWSTKTIMMLVFVSSTLLVTIFSLTSQGTISYTEPFLYIMCISSLHMLANAVIPPLYEQGAECTYLVPEMLSTGFRSFLGRVASFLFHIVFLFPNTDVRWINPIHADGEETTCTKFNHS